MKWHWSLGNKPGAEKQFQKDLKELGATILHYSGDLYIRHWQQTSTGKDSFQQSQDLMRFVDVAKPGDEIYLYCKGKLRAKGIFTGEILPFTRRASDPDPEWKALVESWEKFSEPRKGVGIKHRKIYEIKKDHNNSNNYH